MNAFEVPDFVGRGIATMGDPTRADPAEVRYRTEADLRDAMAALWWLHGWDVRTEVKVPSCGRIDVLATLLNASVIIEMKREITTTTQARQAFQQAHAYHVFLSAEKSTPETFQMDYEERPRVFTMVTAAQFLYGAVQAADDAYSEVHFESFTAAAGVAAIGHWHIPAAATERAPLVAQSRRIRLTRLAESARAAELISVRASEGRKLREFA